MTRFIVRVDDVGQAPDQLKVDRGLEYFTRWWDAGGWGEAPIYLGVVPAGLSRSELDTLHALEASSKAELCIHGWDHQNRILSPRQVAQAQLALPRARAVIPPYNRYDALTFRALHRLIPQPRLPVLFGGMHKARVRRGHRRDPDHGYGPAPRRVGRVLHLSAEWLLEKHCYLLLDVVHEFPDPGYPVVITLHHRWDEPFLRGVGELRQALEGRMVSVEEAFRCASF